MGSPSDSRLALSRRLDWRFLLLEPALKRVTYEGEMQGELLKALQHFSQEVIFDLSADCDLSVLVNPSMTSFRHAMNISPAFYIELYRPDWSQKLRQWSAPGVFLRAARKRGFQAQAYWHYPDFETANRILPLAEVAPLLNVLSKDRSNLKTRITQYSMAGLLRSGLLARILPCISVVGYQK